MTSATSEQIDVLTDRSPPDVLWSRVNTAEAAPGVLVPMTWTLFGYMLEISVRSGFHDLGLLPSSALGYPEHVGERMFGIFHGRFAANVNAIRRIMSGMPGVTGDDVERDLLGGVREGVTDIPYPRRLPAVLAKAPWGLAAGARQPARLRAEYQRWWEDRVGTEGLRSGAQPRPLLKEALARFGTALELQACTRMLFQGANAQLTALAERAGEPDAAGSLMSGSAATEEAVVAGDLWLLANDRLSMATFLSRHGFHGPNSGDIAARSWREDAGPLERLLAAVRDCEPPAERQARAAADRAAVTARVLSALPPGRRALARGLLRLAPLTTRTLERTKTSFMIAIDAGRAAVRAAGAELVSAGTLDDPDDGFHLFAYELLEPGKRDLRALVAERRALRERYLELELPETWEGQPEPQLSAAPARRDVARVTGLGASPGRVEGRVRVVLDAADEIDVDVGDVLVCPTTDPSWLALMTVASALVIDIGAAASHGAIVARELGVPCVIGTRTGTLDLRDGDHVRVDGSAGVVEVLSRAPALSAGG